MESIVKTVESVKPAENLNENPRRAIKRDDILMDGDNKLQELYGRYRYLGGFLLAITFLAMADVAYYLTQAIPSFQEAIAFRDNIDNAKFHFLFPEVLWILGLQIPIKIAELAFVVLVIARNRHMLTAAIIVFVVSFICLVVAVVILAPILSAAVDYQYAYVYTGPKTSLLSFFTGETEISVRILQELSNNLYGILTVVILILSTMAFIVIRYLLTSIRVCTYILNDASNLKNLSEYWSWRKNPIELPKYRKEE